MPARIVDDIDHHVAAAVLVELFVDNPFVAVVVFVRDDAVAVDALVFIVVQHAAVVVAVLELRRIQHAGRNVVFLVDAVAERQRGAVRSSEEG